MFTRRKSSLVAQLALTPLALVIAVSSASAATVTITTPDLASGWGNVGPGTLTLDFGSLSPTYTGTLTNTGLTGFSFTNSAATLNGSNATITPTSYIDTTYSVTFSGGIATSFDLALAGTPSAFPTKAPVFNTTDQNATYPGDIVSNLGFVEYGDNPANYATYGEQYSAIGGTLATVSPVPLPGSVGMFGAALLGLIGFAGSRRKSDAPIAI